eukprot:5645590-Lingulodinium_polyedra.AAC.1
MGREPDAGRPADRRRKCGQPTDPVWSRREGHHHCHQKALDPYQGTSGSGDTSSADRCYV